MVMRSQLRKDNRGIALISVMICATLCLLLSATILRVSLLSYRQKAISKQAASTFYENEAIVDDIKMGLQAKVATAFAVSSTTSRANFVTNFKSSLLSDGGTVGSDKDKIEKALKSYLTGYDPTSTIKDISVTVEGYDDGGTIKYFDESVAGEIVIKNVRIRYTDLERGGYVSEVKTDIRIRSPYVSESTSTGGGYSMFAGSGFTIPAGSTAKPAMLTIEGDIYVGYDPNTAVKSGDTVVSATAMVWSNMETIYWPENSSVTINGDVKISGGSNLVIYSNDVDVRGTIYVSNTSNLIIHTGAKVKCQNIIVECPERTETGERWFDKWENVFLDHKPTLDELPSWFNPNQYNDRFEKRTASYIVTAWNEGKSLSGNYSSGSADTKTYLPTYGESMSSSTVYNTQGNKSGLWAFTNPTSVKRINTKASRISSLPNLTLDSNNKVHPCVKKTFNGHDYYFDEEYVKLIDLDYFLTFATSQNAPFEPGKQMTTSQFSKSGKKYVSNTGLSGISTGDAARQQTYNYGSNKSNTVEVMLGNVQTMNRSDNGGMFHFAIGYEAITLMNDQNTGAQSIGVYITPNSISCTCREGTSTIKALTEMADNTSYAKTFFDGLGRQVMGTNKVDVDHQTINNFFVGGIGVFYEESSGGSGGSGQTVTNYDKEMNATIDIITFENWEKNPAVS